QFEATISNVPDAISSSDTSIGGSTFEFPLLEPHAIRILIIATARASNSHFLITKIPFFIIIFTIVPYNNGICNHSQRTAHDKVFYVDLNIAWSPSSMKDHDHELLLFTVRCFIRITDWNE